MTILRHCEKCGISLDDEDGYKGEDFECKPTCYPDMTPRMALGVALSVLTPLRQHVMTTCLEYGGDMLKHLESLGYELRRIQ